MQKSMVKKMHSLLKKRVHLEAIYMFYYSNPEKYFIN